MHLESTKEQKDIFHFVENGSGHGIIDAVAGAGKTTTIIECAKFIEDRENVLFCAFNNSIANEISRKFREKGMNEVTVKTIHALGRQILHSNNDSGNPIQLNDRKYNELLKSIEIQENLKSFYEQIILVNDLDPQMQHDDRQKFAINAVVLRANNRLIEINKKYRSTLTKETIEDFEKLVVHYGLFNEVEIRKKNFKHELLQYFNAHSQLLEAGNQLSKRTMVIDYTDMLYLPYIWNLSPLSKFGFLFIDECQDLSMAQFAITAKYGKKDCRILAVGDPQQSIYGFTGADIESFKRVKDYTRAVQLPLTVCFRCPKSVIEIAKSIRTDISGLKKEEGVVMEMTFDKVILTARSGDLIISRLKAPLVILVFAFIDKDIKVQIHEAEVEEIINELKNIFKPNELNVVISSLAEGFEQLKSEVLKRWKWVIKKNAERITDSTERNIHIQTETKYLERKMNFLNKKHEQWKDECPSILEILKKIKNFISATDNSIKLSTIHRAKGLENDRVFILNYDDLPLTRLEQKQWEKVQELNLKYVAITRSKSELFFVKPEKLNEIKDEGSLFDELPF